MELTIATLVLILRQRALEDRAESAGLSEGYQVCMRGQAEPFRVRHGGTSQGRLPRE